MTTATAEERRLKAFPVSPGIAIGKALIFKAREESSLPLEYNVEDPELEIARYFSAVERTRKEIAALQTKLKNEGVEDGVEIFEAHLQILQDPSLTTRIEEQIRETKNNAESVLAKALKIVEARFSKVQDPFFRERFKDIQDIVERLQGQLSEGVRPSLMDAPEGSIVFVKELTPSDTAEVKTSAVRAFVAQGGGETSHAAIMAKAKGIPYVASVDFANLELCDGDPVVVDGETGDIIVHPTAETLQHYEALRDRLERDYKLLESVAQETATTRDGVEMLVSGNVEMLGEIETLHSYGAGGIGLFRSEYLFLLRESFPSEEEQYDIYSSLVTKMEGLPVVIRTFDLGGDKFGDFQSLDAEDNPFLGCRAIRLMLREQEIFKTQLRAIVRAASLGDVGLLFPMVSGLPELLEAKALVEEVKGELKSEGFVLPKKLRIGCMIEVPSAAMTCDILAKEIDFLSIGTNDLVQYSLAVDRGNQMISHLYNPTNPGIIRLIKNVAEEGNKQNVAVTVCGEVASDPHFSALLLGLGVHELSVAPRFIPVIKNVIRQLDSNKAKELADAVLQMSTADEIQHALADFYDNVMA